MRSRSVGFTLIELLVVIAIIAVVSVVVVLVLNPAQLLMQSRDSSRSADAASLNTAISLFLTDQTPSTIGSSSITYISIPDPTATSTAGDQCQGLGLPSLGSGNYHCAASSSYRNTNGTGWIPINFSSMSESSPLSQLPADPTNTSSTGLYYTYNASGLNYEITHAMESQKYSGACATDGGAYNDLCESGTNLALAPIDFCFLTPGCLTATSTITPHTYWRLLISGQNGANNSVVMTELILFNAAGNQISTAGGTASASSCYGGCGGSYGPTNIFDGSDSTFWAANATPTGVSPQWIEDQLPSAGGVASFLVEGVNPSEGAEAVGQDPMAFQLQYSDNGTSWTNDSAVLNPSWPTSAWTSYSFPTTSETVPSGKYLNWRVYVSANGSSTALSVAEIQFHTAVSGSQAAVGGRASAHDDYSSLVAGSAFDGNASTIWGSANSVPDSIAYAFTTPVSIVELTWQARSDGFTTQNPTAFELDGSNDGQNWTTVYSFTSPDTWTVGQTRTFDVGQ